MKEFILEVKQFGFKTATDNLFIGLLKSYLGAKKIQVTYEAKQK